MKIFTIELYIRALTTDMNVLERLKLDCDNDRVLETSRRLAHGFLCLADVLEENIKVSRECLLTSFSLLPTQESLDRIVKLAALSGYEVLDTGQSWKCRLHPPVLPSDDISLKCDVCGDFMTPPDFAAPNNTNVALSEALTEEQLGLSPQLCDDLVVVLLSPRYQLLNWLLQWRDLHRLCVLYLNDPKRTKNFITELKYLDIDYSVYMFMKREPEDEELTGIERGYEHYLDEDAHCEDKRSTSSEYSMSQESHPYCLGSDGTGEIPCLPLPTPAKSDPDVLKSLRLFRHNSKRFKIPKVENEVPSKIFVSSPTRSPFTTGHTTITYSNSCAEKPQPYPTNDLYTNYNKVNIQNSYDQSIYQSNRMAMASTSKAASIQDSNPGMYNVNFEVSNVLTQSSPNYILENPHKVNSHPDNPQKIVASSHSAESNMQKTTVLNICTNVKSDDHSTNLSETKDIRKTETQPIMETTAAVGITKHAPLDETLPTKHPVQRDYKTALKSKKSSKSDKVVLATTDISNTITIKQSSSKQDTSNQQTEASFKTSSLDNTDSTKSNILFINNKAEWDKLGDSTPNKYWYLDAEEYNKHNPTKAELKAKIDKEMRINLEKIRKSEEETNFLEEWNNRNSKSEKPCIRLKNLNYPLSYDGGVISLNTNNLINNHVMIPNEVVTKIELSSQPRCIENNPPNLQELLRTSTLLRELDYAINNCESSKDNSKNTDAGFKTVSDIGTEQGILTHHEWFSPTRGFTSGINHQPGFETERGINLSNDESDPESNNLNTLSSPSGKFTKYQNRKYNYHNSGLRFCKKRMGKLLQPHTPKLKKRNKCQSTKYKSDIDYVKKYKLKEARVVLHRLTTAEIQNRRFQKLFEEFVRSAPQTKPRGRKPTKKSENKKKRKAKRKPYKKTKAGNKPWPLQDINPKVNRKTPKKTPSKEDSTDLASMNPFVVLKRLELDNKDKKKVATSVLANVPGLNDLQMIRPSSVDRIVQVVQLPGSRCTTNVPVQSTQTSTQVTPHIQRIGQPHTEKPISNDSDLIPASSSVTNTVVSSTSESSALINILSQQLIQPTNSTNSSNIRPRASPMINILSQQVIKPAVSTVGSTSKNTQTTSDTSVSIFIN